MKTETTSIEPQTVTVTPDEWLGISELFVKRGSPRNS